MEGSISWVDCERTSSKNLHIMLDSFTIVVIIIIMEFELHMYKRSEEMERCGQIYCEMGAIESSSFEQGSSHSLQFLVILEATGRLNISA